MRKKRVLVCGGREFKDREYIFSKLSWTWDNFGDIYSMIHGGAIGADTIAGEWGKWVGIDVLPPFRPDYDAYGQSAPLVRNQRMIDEGKPDLVISFPGKRGTADMRRRAIRHDIPILSFAGRDG